MLSIERRRQGQRCLCSAAAMPDQHPSQRMCRPVVLVKCIGGDPTRFRNVR